MNGALTLKSLKPHTKNTTFPLHIHQQTLTSLQCGSLLQAFTSAKSILQGKKLHAYIISSGILLNNTYLATKISAFYAHCGSMTDARLLFDQITLRNSFLWNSMIRGYACNGFSFNSILMYRQMLSSGHKPDNFTYPFVLKACGDLLLVKTGKSVHCEIAVSGFHSDIYVANSLIAMYSRFGDVGIARKLFDRMLTRDLTTWNTVISGYVKNHSPVEAVNVFYVMTKLGVQPDSTTLVSVLPACANLDALNQGKEIHGFIFKNHIGSSDVLVMNSLIDMYFKCNLKVSAERLFQKMTRRDSVTWNTVILGYAQRGEAFESLRLFCEMLFQGGDPDQVTFITVLGSCHQVSALQFGTSVHCLLFRKGFIEYTNVGTALVDMYAKCANLDCSYAIFNEMPAKNLISWSAMVGGFGIHGKGKAAIAIFGQMKENGIKPDEVTFTTVLSACSHAGLVDEGRMIFHQMVEEYDITPKLEHYSCLVDLLGRAGHLYEAYEVIKTMKIKPSFDVWAALLSACRARRDVKLAEIAARNAFNLNPSRVGSYVLLSNIYAAEKKWGEVERVRFMARQMGLKKPPGCSFIEIDKMVHRFLVADKAHSQSKDIYAKLEELRGELKDAGYTPDTSSVFYDVDEDVKEKMLWDHSERLATAFALIRTSPGTVIRISKNLRVCGDCHTVIKLISKLTGRKIIMRDAHRFHHFSGGSCSCGDYW